jgi:hypothetical protein
VTTRRRLIALVAFVLAVAPPLAAQTGLSIYRDGRVLVRRVIPQALRVGRNVVTFEADAIDPATLFSSDSAVVVVGARAYPPTSPYQGLAEFVGQKLRFVRREGDTVTGVLLSATAGQLLLADGSVTFSDPGGVLLPADRVRSATRVEAVLNASRARPRVEIAYQATGARWEAMYQVVLGPDAALVAGTAVVSPGAMRADSAAVQVVAGVVSYSRYGAYRSNYLSAVTVGSQVQQALERPAAPEDAVGETHVYDLGTGMRLTPWVTVNVALFPPTRATWRREYVVAGVLPFRGWFPGLQGQSPRVPVQVWYTLERRRGTPFGDRPLPGGTVQFFERDTAGNVQLIGEAASVHTAAGRDLRVQGGDAFDITVDRVQTAYRSMSVTDSATRTSRQRITATYQVTIANAKATAATVDVLELREGNWRVTESSVPPERRSAGEVRFRVPVPSGGEVVLTYTVQIES